jgi:hypothetical protein
MPVLLVAQHLCLYIYDWPSQVHLYALEQYLEIRPDKRIKDPIAWWVERKQAFPRLSRLALDLLAIPAMADHCERQFSLAKLSVSTQRCRLQAPNA